jgi:hypothetical protein
MNNEKRGRSTDHLAGLRLQVAELEQKYGQRFKPDDIGTLLPATERDRLAIEAEIDTLNATIRQYDQELGNAQGS